MSEHEKFVAELAENLNRAFQAVYFGEDRDIDVHAVASRLAEGWQVKREEGLTYADGHVIHRDDLTTQHAPTEDGTPLTCWKIVTPLRELTEAEQRATRSM